MSAITPEHPSAASEPPPAGQSAVKPVAKPVIPADADPDYELSLHGESIVDKAFSLLSAFILAAGFIVGWLAFWMNNTRAHDKVKPGSIEIIEVSGGGGDPAGTLGSKQSIDTGGEAADRASNTMEDASEFEEANVEITATGVIDPFMQAASDVANVDIAEAIPGAVAGQVATGRRASKIGTGGPGLGSGGPGDGGYSREQRWVISFPSGQENDDYARELDFFNIELGVKLTATTVQYASKFSQGQPVTRVGLAKSDRRLIFVWAGGTRKKDDVELLTRAGIKVGGQDILQFFPAAVEEQLLQAEFNYKGKQPAEVRRTTFTVAPEGNGYVFKVMSQETWR